MKVVKSKAAIKHNINLKDGVEYDVLEQHSKGFYILNDGVADYFHTDWLTVVDEAIEEQPAQKTIDSHYDLSYTLTQGDVDKGAIKLDPYFVANVWKTGSRDNSGVVFHILKTCARFGEKNEKAREIRAIYKSIKRLAELENVNLE